MARKQIGWWGSVTAASLLGVVLLARDAQGQPPTNGNYEVPPPEYIVPSILGHPRLENGGLYVAGGFKFFMSTNPIKQQIIAVHGLIDQDGSIAAALGQVGPTPGEFVGDRTPALLTDAVSGPLTFVPGYDFTIGWRFESGIALEFNWFHLQDARYSASATSAIPTTHFPGNFQENTFITSFVYNYTPAYNGPADQVGIGNAGATFGIWNASTYQTIQFLQRFNQYQINVRYPIQQTETYRLYSTFGPRQVAIWERFSWNTVSDNVNLVAGPTDQALYTNVVSNELWGLHWGLGNEWYLGTTPIGAFAFSLDLDAALFADFVDAQAKYQLGDLSTAASHKRQFFTISPEIMGSANVWWYPYEGIQVKMGYDAMLFFNTMASQRPVDFNASNPDPGWDRGITRFMNGFTINVAFTF